ncbi:hypothetical protein [uncultured Algibacter sp.]|uniref:hypothetical protein n=1 Tax=uncultured Algibacter sp. TaxID=298659 RepID=UPI00262A34F5|nr:hypothetical protein [uncultured Algibacter sp.]
MRKIFALIFVLSISFTNAQPGGGMQGGSSQGGMRQGGGMQERQERPEFNASQIAGIFSYDDNEAVKKIKIKRKEKELILNVKKAINKYNNNIQEIALLNKDNFDTLNVFVNNIMKFAMTNRGQQQSNSGMQRGGGMQDDYDMQNNDSRDVMRNVMRLSKEKIKPAKMAVNKEEIKLNKKLESILDEKQYQKWLKYQEDFKEDMQPEKPSNNRQSQNQGGGMGGRGGGGGRMR